MSELGQPWWREALPRYAEEVHLKAIRTLCPLFNISPEPIPFPIRFMTCIGKGSIRYGPTPHIIIDTVYLNLEETCSEYVPPLTRKQVLDDFIFTIAHETGHLIHFLINPSIRIRKDLLVDKWVHRYDKEMDKEAKQELIGLKRLAETSADFMAFLYFDITNGENYVNQNLRPNPNQRTYTKCLSGEKMIMYEWDCVGSNEKINSYLHIPGRTRRVQVIDRLLRAQNYREARRIPELNKYFQGTELVEKREGFLFH